jgi:hypothetical protein
VATLEGANLVIFYYSSVSKIWPDKRGGFIRGKELIDKGNEEKLLKKRHRDENIDNCIEVKHFVTEDAT